MKQANGGDCKETTVQVVATLVKKMHGVRQGGNILNGEGEVRWRVLVGGGEGVTTVCKGQSLLPLLSQISYTVRLF